MRKLYRDELANATLSWVMGRVMASILDPQGLYHDSFNHPKGGLDFVRIQSFAHDLHTKVWKYLQGQNRIDGTYSDFAAILSREAKAIFDPHLARSDYDVMIVAQVLGQSTTFAKAHTIPSDGFAAAVDVGEFIRVNNVTKVRL